MAKLDFICGFGLYSYKQHVVDKALWYVCFRCFIPLHSHSCVQSYLITGYSYRLSHTAKSQSSKPPGLNIVSKSVFENHLMHDYVFFTLILPNILN